MPDWQSALSTAGPQAGRIEQLWWVLLATASIVYVAVIGAMAWAALRARRREREGHELPPDAERRMTRVVVAAITGSAIILLGFLVTSFFAGRAIATLPPVAPLVVEVTGRQWWWEFTYADTPAVRRLSTANELHIPVGQPVLFKLKSQDVIHSFWVPALHGKRDLIPGDQATTWFQADTPGVWRAQCAEFCGHQHAKMAFVVVAEPREQFMRWYEEQLRPAAVPADSMRRRGEEVFLASTCIMCHTIRGTPAGGRAGPELTHVGSRRTLAAGTLPNESSHLLDWIIDPQRIKPGVRMPPSQLAAADLRALVAYLEGLK